MERCAAAPWLVGRRSSRGAPNRGSTGFSRTAEQFHEATSQHRGGILCPCLRAAGLWYWSNPRPVINSMSPIMVAGGEPIEITGSILEED
jgi:hypothetical protein